MSRVVRLRHDPLCPTCPSHDDVECECPCLCDFIADVRDDERRRSVVPDHTVAAGNRP